MLAQDNKDIRQAYTLLQVISQDKVKRMAYEARQAPSKPTRRQHELADDFSTLLIQVGSTD
jgi:hypothetical protein